MVERSSQITEEDEDGLLVGGQEGQEFPGGEIGGAPGFGAGVADDGEVGAELRVGKFAGVQEVFQVGEGLGEGERFGGAAGFIEGEIGLGGGEGRLRRSRAG